MDTLLYTLIFKSIQIKKKKIRYFLFEVYAPYCNSPKKNRLFKGACVLINKAQVQAV